MEMSVSYKGNHASLGAPQRSQPQKQRTVALAERGTDAGAFQQRAEKSATKPSDVRQFSNGDEIITALQDLSASGTQITKIVVHSHGYGAGIIGVDPSTGLYIDWEQHPERLNAAANNQLTGSNSQLDPAAATTADLVAPMTGDNPSIRVAQGATIVLFGCNSTALASHLSYQLDQAGRGDIQVVGATNFVYPSKNGEPRVDHGGTFQTYQGGRMISETKRMKY